MIPSTTQQRFKEVQIKVPGQDRTPPSQRKFQTSSPPSSRHVVKEVLVSISRGSSPEKQYHSSSIDMNDKKKKKLTFSDVSSENKKTD